MDYEKRLRMYGNNISKIEYVSKFPPIRAAVDRFKYQSSNKRHLKHEFIIRVLFNLTLGVHEPKELPWKTQPKFGGSV